MHQHSEKDLCKTLDIPSLNIESIQGLEKSESHNPRTEVNCYFHRYGNLLIEITYCYWKNPSSTLTLAGQVRTYHRISINNSNNSNSSNRAL